MINLIPKEEKKKIIADFYRRLAVLFLITLNVCVLVLFVLVSPAYFISSGKENLVDIKLGVQKNEPLPLVDEQSLLAIGDINNKLTLIENSEKNKFVPSVQVINAILLKKRSDVKIMQFLYENDAILGKKIKIIGTAPSRAILLIFRQALEDNPAFRKVDLPISNFVKGADIQFYLSLVPA